MAQKERYFRTSTSPLAVAESVALTPFTVSQAFESALIVASKRPTCPPRTSTAVSNFSNNLPPPLMPPSLSFVAVVAETNVGFLYGISCGKRLRFRVFLMFVPSLSWQNDRLEPKHWRFSHLSVGESAGRPGQPLPHRRLVLRVNVACAHV